MQRDTPLAGAATLTWPGFVLDLARGELFDDAGRPTGLRAQALKVLLVLGEQAGEVVGKDQLMQRVWGDVIVTEDSLVQAIGDIRRVLGDQAAHAHPDGAAARLPAGGRGARADLEEAPPAFAAPPRAPAATPSRRWFPWAAAALLLRPRSASPPGGAAERQPAAAFAGDPALRG